MTNYTHGDKRPVDWSEDDSDDDVHEEPALIPAIHRFVFGNTTGGIHFFFCLLVTHLRPCSLLWSHTEIAVRLDDLLLYTLPSL